MVNVNKYNKRNMRIFIILLFAHAHTMDAEMKVIPYTATTLAVVGRFIFMFLLWKNKSTNSLSLLFCLLSICSSGMWIYYSVSKSEVPMLVRSIIEIALLSVSSGYIVYNKVRERRRLTHMVLPIYN